jgi:cell division septum initiation protein DivIVA
MSEHGDLLTEAGMVQWEREVRGYNRQQVDEYVAWRSGQMRDLESRLAQGATEVERLRRELSEAHESSARPAHEEISERVGQILKLAADEAQSDRARSAAEIAKLRETAKEETDKLRTEVKRETDQIRADAQDQAERMLSAAQEQSESSVATAKAEAEQLVSTAQAAAERAVADATKHAESTVGAAIAQAKQQLDDATARATAIHEGAERRLNLLISRHTETVRRLTEIRDVVTSLVSGEAARGSLEDEVNRALGGQASGEGRQSGQHDPLQASGHRAGAARPAEGRHPGAAGPLDGPAGQPLGPGRRPGASGQAPGSRPGSSGQPGSRDRDRPDPLDTSRRHDVGRPSEAADADADTDGAGHPADALTHPSEGARHASGTAGATPSHASDRALDEAASPSRGIDS